MLIEAAAQLQALFQLDASAIYLNRLQQRLTMLGVAMEQYADVKKNAELHRDYILKQLDKIRDHLATPAVPTESKEGVRLLFGEGPEVASSSPSSTIDTATDQSQSAQSAPKVPVDNARTQIQTKDSSSRNVQAPNKS